MGALPNRQVEIVGGLSPAWWLILHLLSIGVTRNANSVTKECAKTSDRPEANDNVQQCPL